MTKVSLALLSIVGAAFAQPLEISGPARVTDGDTVVVSGVRVRLKGIDAAERGTDLGDAATIIMKTIVDGGPLTCVLTGERTWKREVGFCFLPDGTDINKEIISQGAALACPRYDQRYLPFEQADQIAVQPRAHYCTRKRR